MQVFDLNKNIPTNNSCCIWIDTNILLWFFYYPTVTININKPKHYQMSIYPKILASLINENYRIFTTVYNVSEVISVIEKIEYDNYLAKDTTKKKGSYNFKRFKRDNIDDLHNKIKGVLFQIKSLIIIDNSGFNFADFRKYLSIYADTKMNFFDYILSRMADDNCDCLITDDYDFLDTKYQFNVYTANNKFIQEAAKNNLLYVPST